MQAFEFHTAKSIVVEPGACAMLAPRIRHMGGRSVLIVTDPGVLAAGLLAPVQASLADAGIACACFAQVEPDPPEHVVLAAVEQAVAAGADCIVGFGGGSSLDVAKLVAVLALGKELLENLYGTGLVKGPRLPLLLVPTTAGTGSEVTPISIVTTGEGIKKGVVSPVLLPDLAVLDADLTLGLPRHVTAATGIDAMVHAIEAYTSKRLKNPFSDGLACRALALLAANIHEVCRAPANRAARQDMLMGACLAGMAFANAPVGGVHALAYPVGARFHVPHGLSNSLVLGPVLRFNLPAAAALYAELADIVLPGCQGSATQRAMLLIAWLEALPAELGIPARLSEVGIAATDIARLAEDAMQQTRLLINNPRELRGEDALTLYRQAL